MQRPLPEVPHKGLFTPLSRLPSHPVPSAPGAGPCPEADLGLELHEDFGNGSACSSGGSCPDPPADQNLRAPLAKPFMLLLYFTGAPVFV